MAFQGYILCILTMQNAALRTTLEVSKLSEVISFFSLYSKNLQATHACIVVTLPNIFLRMPQ